MIYLFLGSILSLACRNLIKAAMSMGLCTITWDKGCLSSWDLGLVGLAVNPPLQLGHTLFRIVSTQVLQKVHSYVHIIAW